MGTASAASLQSNVPASGRQLGAIGYVIPGVLPAGLTRLGNRVVGSVGDAAFLTGSSDFVTICQLELPVAIAVHTFRHIGNIHTTLMAKFGRSYATDIGKVDFARYAAAFAATGIRVDEPPIVDDAWSAALTADRPLLFDLRAGHTFPAVAHRMRHPASASPPMDCVKLFLCAIAMPSHASVWEGVENRLAAVASEFETSLRWHGLFALLAH